MAWSVSQVGAARARRTPFLGHTLWAKRIRQKHAVIRRIARATGKISAAHAWPDSIGLAFAPYVCWLALIAH